MSNLLILGYGYTGGRFGAHMSAQGWAVTGTRRESADAPHLLQWPGDDLTQAIHNASHLLVCAAPDAAGDPFIDIVGKAKFDWVGYLSTTGVYGDHQGDWVDETTPLTPATVRGQHRVIAEKQWLNSGLPVHIFRLAGIYGPERGPFTKVKNGTARRIIKPNQVFSRIHVEDILQVLDASIKKPNPGQIYNVCDHDPAPPEDVIALAARMLNLPVPPAIDYDTADLTPMARSFYAESKKVSNARIIDELGVTLRYPDALTGLKALLDASGAGNHLT